MPYSPIAQPNPQTTATSCPKHKVQQPQCWDLAMLRERRQSSHYASLADSGFHEPAMYAQPFPMSKTESDPNHTYAHELLAPSIIHLAPAPLSKQSSLSSEMADIPELLASPISPTKLEAEDYRRERQRRYSENTIQLIKGELTAPKRHFSGNSTGGSVPAMSRSLNAHLAAEANAAVEGKPLNEGEDAAKEAIENVHATKATGSSASESETAPASSVASTSSKHLRRPRSA